MGHVILAHSELQILHEVAVQGFDEETLLVAEAVGPTDKRSKPHCARWDRPPSVVEKSARDRGWTNTRRDAGQRHATWDAIVRRHASVRRTKIPWEVLPVDRTAEEQAEVKCNEKVGGVKRKRGGDDEVGEREQAGLEEKRVKEMTETMVQTDGPDSDPDMVDSHQDPGSPRRRPDAEDELSSESE